MFGFTNAEVSIALLLAVALMLGLWGPYLYKEIVRGKAKEGWHTPRGAGDTHPGTVRNPAPGQPDAQADPYEPRASR